MDPIYVELGVNPYLGKIWTIPSNIVSDFNAITTLNGKSVAVNFPGFFYYY